MNVLQGRAITSLLEHYRWEAYSIVYSDGGTQGDVHKHLVREAHAHGLKTVVAEPIPLKVREQWHCVDFCSFQSPFQHDFSLV